MTIAKMTKAQRAINALREAAEAVEALPNGMRTVTLFGMYAVHPDGLREEADRIQDRASAWAAANEPVED